VLTSVTRQIEVLSNGTNKVGSYSPSTEYENIFKFGKFVRSIYLEFLTMGIVGEPSDSECYTPSSEPFGFYKI
jgi:hypothetical protein